MELIARLRGHLDEIARQMLERIVAEVPVYGHLPREQLEGEILAILRANMSFFLDSLERGGRPDPDALAELKASAARRAEERVPLAAVLAAYHVGSSVAWEWLVRLAGDAPPDDPASHDNGGDELLAYAPALMTYVQDVTTAVSDAYVEERGTIAADEREARRAMLDAVLAGDFVGGLAERLGQTPPPTYVAVALALGPSSDEVDADVEGAVAARRKVRRVEQFLAERGGAAAPYRIDARGGVALLPAAGGGRAVASEIPALVEALGKAADAEVWAGFAWRGRLDRIPAAMAEAREVVRLAQEQGRAPGAYAIDDVLLEYLAATPGPGRDRLVRLLDPLVDGPDLVATIEAWFDADFSRRRAADILHVHPNTLDYRLKRVGELTGLDPATARGLQLLGAAVTARRVTSRGRGS